MLVVELALQLGQEMDELDEKTVGWTVAMMVARTAYWVGRTAAEMAVVMAVKTAD